MRTTTLFIACCLLAVALHSCTKTGRIYYSRYSNPSIDGLTFQPGTYWVFRDSNSAGLDSFVVSSLSYDTLIINDEHLYADQRTMNITGYRNSGVGHGILFVGYRQIHFDDGFGNYIDGDIENAPTLDTSILNTAYNNVQAYGRYNRYMLSKNNIGIIQYNNYFDNYGISELKQLSAITL